VEQQAQPRARRAYGIRVLLLAALWGLQPAPPASAQATSEAAFTREVADVLRAQASGSEVTVTRNLELRVKNAQGKEATVFLDNAYTAYRANPKARSEIIRTYVQSFLETMSSMDAAVDRSRIVPVVKDRAWLAETQKSLKTRGAKEFQERVYEALNRELVIVYAEDSPRNIRYLSPKDVADLGLKTGELRGLAVANLKKLLPKVEVRQGALVSIITAGGDYEASLLLLDHIWSSRQLVVDGDIVVAIPARDLLLFTGSRNRAGIAKLREVASEAARDASYRITDRLFVYRDGSFQPFDK